MTWVNISEAYMTLFLDSFLSNVVIFPSNEFMIYSMRTFDTYDIYAIVFWALAGSLCAFLANYFIGYLIFRAFKHLGNSKISSRYEACKPFIKGLIGYVLACFSFIPFFGNFIQVIFGLFKTRFLTVLLIFLLAKATYYFCVIF